MAAGHCPVGTGTPVVTNSKLGWLPSGPSATGGGHQQSVHLIAMHVMKVECSEIDPLTEQVSRFWDLDSIGMKENEPSVYETFVENIKHDGTRYEVNLPWKPLTIPGKELLSALLMARLITSVRSALENFITISSVNCWLDSSISLHWVTNNENQYKPYIENRRQEIRKLVDPISFNYCPTKENPADHTTRGLPLSKLAQNTLWVTWP